MQTSHDILPADDLLPSVIDALPSGVLVTHETQEAQGVIAYANRAFERLTGYHLSEIVEQCRTLFDGPNTDRDSIVRVAQSADDAPPVRIVQYGRNERPFTAEIRSFALSNGHRAFVYSEVRPESEFDDAVVRLRETVAARVEESPGDSIARAVALEAAVRQQAAVARLAEWALDAERDEVLYDEAVRLVASGTGAPHCGFFRIDWRTERDLELVAGHGLVARESVSSDGLLDPVHLHQGARPLTEDEVRAFAPFLPDESPLTADVPFGMIAPIRSRRGSFGALVAITQNADPFSQSDEHFVTALASIVSTRLERERAARHDARFGLVVDSSPDAIMLQDYDGTIETWNRAAEDLLGFEASEVIGRHLRMLATEGSAAVIRRMLERIDAGESPVEADTTLRSKSDRDVEVTLTIYSVSDGRGRHTGLASIVRDISERCRSERELRRDNTRLQAIVDTAADAILTIDTTGRIESANRAAKQMLGFESDDLEGAPVSGVVPSLGPADASTIGRLLTMRSEVTCRRRDGSTFPADLSVGEMRLDGARLATVILRDVSRRRAVEEELERHRLHLESLVKSRSRELDASHARLRVSERMASIGTLAAGLGHDIKNLIFPIQCRLDAVEAVIRSPRAQTELVAVRRSLDYLRRLSDGLRLLVLDPAEHDPGHEVTELGPWWADVQPLLTRALPDDVTLAVGIAHDLPPVAVQPHSLTQAVLNLVVNAAEAMEGRGGIDICAEAEGDSVRLTVTDDGPGMAPEVLKHALDPFFTTKSRGISTGLGLSLVRGIAEHARGSIDVQSAPAEGTTVTLTLPISPIDVREAQRGVGSAMITVADPRLAGSLEMVLESEGFAIFSATEASPDPPLWITDRAPIGSIDPAWHLVLLSDDVDPADLPASVTVVPPRAGAVRAVVRQLTTRRMSNTLPLED